MEQLFKKKCDYVINLEGLVEIMNFPWQKVDLE